MFDFWWIYALVGFIFLYVLTQSLVALLKAVRQAKVMGFSSADIQKTITSSAILSIAPSIAILISLVVLSQVFGPWIAGIRLGTLGAVTYELPAAINVIEGAFGADINGVITLEMGITAVWVMTLGCIPPLLLVPFFYKKISARFEHIKEKNSEWKDILMDALFLGMISAFVGYVIAPIEPEDGGASYISLLAILVLVASALFVTVFGLLSKKKNFSWLKSYALPLSMILSMALAIVFATWGVR